MQVPTFFTLRIRIPRPPSMTVVLLLPGHGAEMRLRIVGVSSGVAGSSSVALVKKALVGFMGLPLLRKNYENRWINGLENVMRYGQGFPAPRDRSASASESVNCKPWSV